MKHGVGRVTIVIDSVHPEESIEVFREQMSGYKTMAQTVFLTATFPALRRASTCRPMCEVATSNVPTSLT